MQIRLDIEGVDGVLGYLRKVEGAVAMKVVAQAQRKALKPLVTDARMAVAAETDVHTGRLKRSVGIKKLRSGSPFDVAHVGGYRYGVLGAPHAHLIESGTKERFLKRPRLVTFVLRDGREVTVRVHGTGKVDARNIMRDAVARNDDQVRAIYEMELLNSLNRVISN